MKILSDVCIIGGGIAGLTLARSLARSGATVTLVEREELGRGAGYAAAGMLAPLVEAKLDEREVVGFGHEALGFYPGFIAAIEEETGLRVDYRSEGTLIVGTDRDETEQIRHQYEGQRRMGLPVEWLSGYECRRIEPCLAPGIPGGIFSPHDHQVDNRLLLAALVASLRAHGGVTIVDGAGEGELIMAPGARPLYRIERGIVEAGEMVIATGAGGALLRAIDPGLARSIRPVKGQIMRLNQSAMPLLGHVVRTPEMYLAPKSSGMMVLGASSEDRGFDPNITAGEIFELLRAAWECVPGIYELPIAETRVGFRPATIDHMPMIGPSGADHIWLAMGYYRHGILFSPYAADLLASRVLGAGNSPWLDTFSPERFHETATERADGRDPLADHP